MTCLDDNTVAAFVEGALSKEKVAEVDAHVDACADCRLLLASMAVMLSHVSRSATPSITHGENPDEGGQQSFALAAAARVGRVLKDKWRLEKLLGIGGSAAVYKATHKTNGGRVAIKIMHEPPIDYEDRQRFLREGYASNAVEHPGIVRIIDDDIDADGHTYLVTDFVAGEPLSSRARRDRTLPPGEVLSIADQILDVLAAAHERGIIHRDVKPANILLTAGGGVRLLDFGIARVEEPHDAKVLRGPVQAVTTSSSFVVVGTPAFMAPEQALGRAEARSDVWAVGATMFTLLSGRLVHEAGTTTELLLRAVRSPAPKLTSVAPGAPADVCAIVDKALALEARDRWPSAREMQTAIRAVTAALVAAPAATAAPRRRRWPIWIAAGAVIPAVAIAAFALRPKPPPTAALAEPRPSATEPGPLASASVSAPLEIAAPAASSAEVVSAPSASTKWRPGVRRPGHGRGPAPAASLISNDRK